MASKPWAFIAHKGEYWGGLCVADTNKKMLSEFFTEFLGEGWTITPVYDRAEYNAMLERMTPMSEKART